jgi:urate oxidase
MSEIILGKHQYGKAENRIVRIHRDTPRHEIRDLNVSTCLRGHFSAAYLAGDQYQVLPTDSQKQTAYAYAKQQGVQSIEDYGLALARHFTSDVGPVEGARIEIEEFAWERVLIDGTERDHTWTRKGQEVRTAAITVDRVMATSLVAQWRYHGSDGGWQTDWDATYAGVKTQLVKQFAVLHSLALQQTLFEMGKAVLETYPTSPRFDCRRPTSTTSSTTCRPSAWTMTTRCSTPTTGRTASSRLRSSGKTLPRPARPGRHFRAGWGSSARNEDRQRGRYSS